MDTHLHSQPAHTALNWGLMQRWKQSRGAANTAAHFKSIPFPGHQLQQQHRKPSLILPLLDGVYAWQDPTSEETHSSGAPEVMFRERVQLTMELFTAPGL